MLRDNIHNRARKNGLRAGIADAPAFMWALKRMESMRVHHYFAIGLRLFSIILAIYGLRYIAPLIEIIRFGTLNGVLVNLGFKPKGARVTEMKIQLESQITCPDCGTSRIETLPTDAWQWFYKCSECTAILKPLPGDCCVFLFPWDSKVSNKSAGGWLML